MENKNRKMTITERRTREVDLNSLEEILKAVKSADDIDEEGKEFLVVCAEGILRKLKTIKELRKEPEATKKATNNKENERRPDKKPTQNITEDDEQEIEELAEEFRNACDRHEEEMEEIISEFGLDELDGDFHKVPKDKRKKLRSRIAELDVA